MKLTVILNADATGLIGTVRVSEAELRKLGATLDRTEVSGGKAGRGLRETGQGADSAAGGARRLSTTLNQLKGTLATLGIAKMVTEFIHAGRAMDRYNVSLAAAMGSQEQGGREMAFLRSEAQRLGLYLPSLIQGYTGLAAATRGTNLEGEQTRLIFSAVAEAGRAMNLTQDQIAGTMNALQQIAGKGTVSMEELRQQLGDRLPGAMQIAARAMNMPVSALVKMVSEGKLASDVFLPKFAAELSKASAAGVEFAKNSPEAIFMRMKTSLFELGAAISGSGLLGLLADVATYVGFLADELATRWPRMIEIWRDALAAAFSDTADIINVNLEALLGATSDATSNLLGRIVEEFMILPVSLRTVFTVIIGEFDKLLISAVEIFQKVWLSGKDAWLALEMALIPVAGNIKLVFARMVDEILGRLASMIASAANVAEKLGADETAAKLNQLSGSLKGVAVAEELVRQQIEQATAAVQAQRDQVAQQAREAEQRANQQRAIANDAIQASLDEREAALAKLRATKDAADATAAAGKAAAAAAAQAEEHRKAQEKLTAATRQWENLLGRVAGALDPVSKAQEKHNQFVRDATAQAEKLIKLGGDELSIRAQLAAAIQQSATNRDAEVDSLRRQQQAYMGVLNDLDAEAALIAMNDEAREQHIASMRAEEAMRRAIAVAQQAGAELEEEEIERLVRMAGARAAMNEATAQTKKAWEDFTGGLADAVLDGSKGVKRWWKQMIDDMKRQLIQSGLLKIFGQIFNTGGAQAGSGFGSMFAAMLGGGAQAGSAASAGGVGFGQLLQLAGAGGGTGGSLLTGLAGAISGGISTGLMSLGGGLAGLGMGGLGGGLAWAGGSIAANGLLGGLGGSFMTGLGNLFGGGSALMGVGQMIPAIAAAAAIAAAIQKLSGGKLFGTSYGFDSAAQNIDFSGAGVDGNSTVTEVRQRSLFRGRKWRTTSSALDDEVRGPLEDFWNAVLDSNTAIARQFGRAAAIDVPASFRQEFNAKGDVTAEIGTILGKTYRETWEVFAKRISAENIIANIDGMLGTLAPAPGTGGGGGGGGGGGSRRRGDDYDQLASLGGAVPLDVQAQVGEASAIAERWRHDAELLAEGAQFLLLAASDIRAGAGLLGDDGTLTQITALIEDLQASGETLSATYARVAGSAALLDQALALSGVQIDGTREHIVRLATDITTAAGGLERASALWGAYFDRFYSDSERAAFALTQAQASAAREFGDIGLDYATFTGEGGVAEFRRLFEEALPSLSAEAIVEWLEAAAALGIWIDATDALNAALGEVGTVAAQTADQLAAVNDILDGNAWDLAAAGMTEAQRAVAEITRAYDDHRQQLLANAATAEQLATLEAQRAQALEQAEARRVARLADFLDGITFDASLAGMTALDAEIARLTRQFDDYIAQATALGATEEQLATIRDAGAAAIARAEEAEAARLARAANSYAEFVTGVLRETQQLSAYQSAMADADEWRTSAIAKANEHARAAGMAGASEQALALIELRAAQLRGIALAQLREETQSLVDQLYGPGLSDALTAGIGAAGDAAGDYWAAQRRAAETLQNYLDSMLLGDLSALTPEQQLAEAWEQLNAAVTAGDADQATRLADVYLRMLRGMEASGDDYNQGFWSVRELLEGMLADIGEPPESEPGGGGGGYITADGAEQIAARNRLELAAQLAQHLADLAGAVGQTVWELMDSMGVDLRQLTADLGISLQDITAETVLALVNMAGLLGTNLLDLTSELGLQLTDLGGGIRELAENTGINLDALTVQSTQALGALANQLGIDLADIAASVGVDLGSLADAQSLLNQALAGEINRLPAEQGDALRPYLAAIENATSEADANAAIDALSGHVNTLAPDIRNALAPYFADVFPVDALTDLDYLTQIATDGAAQLAAAQAANALLARIADNAAAANVAADIPSYAVGTWRVPQTGPAILHAGEMVLPVPLARVLRGAGGRGGQDGGDTRALLEELRRIGEKVDRLERSGRGNTQELVTAIDSTGERSDRERDLALSRHNIGPRGRTP